MSALDTVRVRDVAFRPAMEIDGATDLVTVCRMLAEHGQAHALVREPDDRLALFATDDLCEALLHPEPPQQIPLRDVADFDAVEIDIDADVFEAMSTMSRHHVQRLLVRDGNSVAGVVDLVGLAGFAAHEPQVLARRIDAAASTDDLVPVAGAVDEMSALLHRGGVPAVRIARRVGALNARIFERLWTLLAPAELVAGSCLLVMGSEGRGEQILKTDQDNALVLCDGFAGRDVAHVAADFNAALTRLGYPPCPGDIMLTNPRWRQPLSAFRETLREWVHGPPGSGVGGGSADGAMNLAIFFDAQAVAGNPALLNVARDHLDALVDRNDAFMARFAAAADQFSEPGGWRSWLRGGLHAERLDLKKLGTFPIVHGVRALSLQYHVRARGTLARLERLAAEQRIDRDLARDLGDALQRLMDVRLTQQLRQRGRGEAAGNEVRIAELGRLERESLRAALDIVRDFRAFLRRHFTLAAL